MPELPEVETVVQGLRPTLLGKTIATITVLGKSSVSGSPRSPNYFKDQKITNVSRIGKYILITSSKSACIAIHLRMTGWLGIKSVSERRKENDPYIRVQLLLKEKKGDHQELLIFRDIRRFGRMWFGTEQEILALPSISKLGPDALEISCETFQSNLHSRRGRIKSLLLNQTFLAGLGNIYADEALYAARIHPESLAHTISKAKSKRLHSDIQQTLKRALAAGGSSIDDYLHPDGTPGWFQRALKAYGRTGQPCGRCKTAITRMVIGQRGSWFCPNCQKE